MDENRFYQSLLDRLLKEDQYIITTHRNPDPDGLGAELALEYLLRHFGKEVLIVNHDILSPKYQFIDSENRLHSIIRMPDPERLYNKNVIIVDNSSIDRTGDIKKFIKDDLSNLIVIDHHDGMTPDYHTFFQNPDIGSSSEMLFELFQHSGVDFPYSVARALYAGIAVDTGHFRYRKTRPRTHEIAAELIRKGVNPTILAEQLFANAPVERLFLKKKLYQDVRIDRNNHIAWFEIRKSEVEAMNLVLDDLEGMVNELIEPTDIFAAMIFTEREPGLTRVSVRSKGDVNMIPSVEKYGGGGHKNACGATIPLDLEEAVQDFIPTAVSCVKNSVN